MSEAMIKAAVRSRDDYRCTDCGMTQAEHIQRFGSGLEVHRIVPGSEYSLQGCVTVCRPCHQGKPRRKRRPTLGENPFRTTVDFTEDTIRRINAVRGRFAETLSGYIRRAVVERLMRDDPPRP